jgi:hypothetical protein
MCLDCKIEDNTGFHRCGKPHGHELLGAPERARFDENTAMGANFAVEVTS